MHTSSISLLSFLAVVASVYAQDSASVRQNVTYLSSDLAFDYIAPCATDTRDICVGRWWTERDPKYSGGSARVCGDPKATGPYKGKEPYVDFKFTGTAVYVYQWINRTSAAQAFTLTGLPTRHLDFTTGYNWPFAINEEATLTLTYSETGLESAAHVLRIEHTEQPDGERFIVLDHVVVEEGAPIVVHKKSNKAAIIGAAVGGSVGGILLIIGILYLLGQRQARKRKEVLKKQNLEGGPQMGQVMDPSAEMQLSEMLYREELEARRQKEIRKRRGSYESSLRDIDIMEEDDEKEGEGEADKEVEAVLDKGKGKEKETYTESESSSDVGSGSRKAEKDSTI